MTLNLNLILKKIQPPVSFLYGSICKACGYKADGYRRLRTHSNHDNFFENGTIF